MNNNISLFSGDIKNTFILHIPHSSTHIPFTDGYINDLYKNEIQLLTDHATDKIFDIKGIDKLVCGFSRVFCDVERFADSNKEPMANFGMGMIYTHTDDGQKMRDIDNKLFTKIKNQYYQKYHNEFSELVGSKINEYGVARIIDCHSFTSTPFKRDLDQIPHRADICIGTDPFNTPKYLFDYIYNFFKNHHFSVTHNSPYTGTITPQMYQNDKRVESIMIEINRDLYMVDGKADDQFVNQLNNLLSELMTFN